MAVSSRDNPGGPQEIATAWLRAWIEKGGTAHRDPRFGLTIGWREYHDSGQHRADVKALGRAIPEHANVGFVHRYDGMMRAMFDMLGVLPGVRDAVDGIVTVHSAMGIANQGDA